MHVIIATASDPPLLRRTLASLASCRLPAGYAGLWVVENGGRRGVEQALAAAPAELRAVYRYQAQPGKSAALNTAMREIGTGLAVFLDDDVRLAPEALAAYAEAADAEPGCYFGGPCGVDYEHPPADYLRKYLPFSARGWEPQGEYGPDRPMVFLGFNWAARVEAVLAAGGFPEDLGPGRAMKLGDEDAIQRALIRQGLTWCYVRGARVWHWVPADRCTPAWLIERGYYNGRSRALARPQDGMDLGWLRRREWTAALRSAWAGLTRSREARFRAQIAQSINRGLREGYRPAVTPGNGAPR